MSGALSHITVLDFGQYVAGPLTTMLLADQGADVIRIDPPTGPTWRTTANHVWNRGKRRITLDLKEADDVAVALELMARSDVVVENFRPGVMERLGLGHDEALRHDPSLVFCSLPGFAHDDHRHDVPAWEGVVQAAAAVPAPDASDPEVSAVPLASTFGAFYAVASIASALAARDRDGLGQWIEIPLFDAALGAHGFRVQRVHHAAPVPDPDVGLPGLHAWMGVHRCKDGRYIFFHPGNKFSRDFLAAVCDPSIESWSTSRQTIDELFMTRTAAEWEELGRRHETEVALFRTTSEWLHEPHALAAGLVVTVDDPVHGVMHQPGVQVHLDRSPGRVRGPAGSEDADQASIRELASSARKAPTPAAGPTLRAALQGVKVLELSQLLAGPTCGRTMVEFGADVIKIDNPLARPTPAPWIPSFLAFGIDVNRGKRSVQIDLKTQAGKDIFMQLAADADVIIQNYRPGVTDRLGIGYDDIAAINPRIVYASINAYGPAGPWRDKPGHEQIGQAATGMAERFGGDRPPSLQVVRAPTDHGTGILAAYAIGLALIDRERTGRGQEVTTALAATAATLQAPFLFDHEGRTWDEPRGRGSKGSGALSRYYRTLDGWVFLGCPPDRVDDLLQALAISSASGRSSALEDRLDDHLRRRTAQDVVDALGAQHIGAHRLTTIAQLLDDPELRARGVITTRDHEGIGPVDQLGPVPRLRRTPTVLGSPRRPPGSDAREVLGQYGLGAGLPDLVRSGAVWLP